MATVVNKALDGAPNPGSTSGVDTNFPYGDATEAKQDDIIDAIGNPIAAGTNTIGKLAANAGVNIGEVSLKDISAGEYETVAASQTAQVLGATGATGDYLSHVVVQPTSITPGVVTVLDNATEVHAYPGGTVSADLVPFTIPIAAYSVSGAWKITTGANVKVTAYGNFT